MPSKSLKTLKPLDARTLEQWRAWLTKHHDSVPEVWLIFHKRHTGKPSISYSDALDEALCFGWIDSLVRRLDDDRYARKFTPRKAESWWSAINKKRYAELDALGRVRPPGRERPPKDRTYGEKPKMPSTLPDYIRRAFKKSPAAWKYFESLAPSHQRHYWGWVHLAKQEETRQRRLKEAIERLAAGQLLGLK